MAQFKGFKQVTLEAYNEAVAQGLAANYLWLVRDLSGNTAPAIYFGTRKYAEVNDDSVSNEKFENLIASIGDLVDENGEFLGFLPVAEHEILASAETMTEAFEALEGAILALKAESEGDVETVKADVEEIKETLENKVDETEFNETVANLESATTANAEKIAEVETAVEDVKDALEEKVDVNDFNEAVTALESATTANAAEIEAVKDELATKADADNVYTKEEIDEKVAGVFHFVGVAETLSADGTVISGGDAGEGITASEENNGYVFAIGDKEFASNGAKWVELGFEADLTPITNRIATVESGLSNEVAAREELEEKVDEIDSALTVVSEKTESLENRMADAEDAVAELESKSTTTASTYADAAEMDLELGQIVYIVNDEEGESGHTAGSYINTQAGLKKLESSSGTGDTPVDRIESLENKVGSTELPAGETITSIISQLITISGDDVEE